MKTLVLANQKGGVGKSAITTQFAHYLNRLGLRVLVIDLDHQQNTSSPLRANASVSLSQQSSADVLRNGLNGLPTSSFVLIPGDAGLSMLEREPEQHKTFVNNLAKALKSLDDAFDVCLIDTNPNPDVRYAAGLICAQYALAPIQLNQEAIDGISALFSHPRYGFTKIKSLLNPDLSLIGILPNLVEPTPFQKSNLTQLIQKFSQYLIFNEEEGRRQYAFIRKRSIIAEAQAAAVFITDLKKTSSTETWKEVKPVFDMILHRMGINTKTQSMI